MTEVDMMFQIAARRIQGLTAKVNHWKQRADKLEADLGVEKAARLVPPTHYDEIPEMEKQRDGLMAQVQDMRKEIARLRADLRTMSERSNGSEWEQKAVELEELRAELNSVKQERDCAKDEWDRTEERCKTLVGEVAELFSDRQRLKAELAVIKDERNELRIKLEASEAESRGYYEELSRIRRKTAPCEPNTPTPRSHPVKVGEWVKVKDDPGAVHQVSKVHADWYVFATGWGCTFNYCIPCDPPESTEQMMLRREREFAVKEAAANALEDQAAADIKVGDCVEVFQATNANWTLENDIGIEGTVKHIEMTAHSIPIVLLSNDGAYALRDVRKIQRALKPGDKVRMFQLPPPSPSGTEWDEEWGKIGDIGTISNLVNGGVRIRETGYEWPLSCIEIIDAK